MVRLCYGAAHAGTKSAGHDLAGKALLADEPTSAQDPLHAVRTVGLLRGLAARGAGVIAVMHDLSLALRLGDDAALLACDGQLAAEGPVRDALAPERLRSVFGVEFALAQTARGGLALIAGEAADAADGPLPSATAKDRS
jgi:iron complex transport system ATP-binding protein